MMVGGGGWWWPSSTVVNFVGCSKTPELQGLPVMRRARALRVAVREVGPCHRRPLLKSNRASQSAPPEVELWASEG